METIQDYMPLINDIITGLGLHFGPHCEFVVHDYQQPDNRTIISIVNGELTHRKVGDCSTSIGLRVSQGVCGSDGESQGIFNYMTQTTDGRTLKSSTIYLHNSNHEIIGSLCINYDITNLQMAMSALQELVDVSKPQGDLQEIDQILDDNIDQLLIRMIQESMVHIGIPISQMTKADKIKGVKMLYERGAFKIQRAIDVIAQYYCVSKFTIYNYLNELDSMKYAEKNKLQPIDPIK